MLAVQKLAEIIKRLEANGRKVTDTSDQVKSIGFIGGVDHAREEINLHRSKRRKTGSVVQFGMNAIRPDQRKSLTSRE